MVGVRAIGSVGWEKGYSTFGGREDRVRVRAAQAEAAELDVHLQLDRCERVLFFNQNCDRSMKLLILTYSI